MKKEGKKNKIKNQRKRTKPLELLNVTIYIQWTPT